MTAAAGRPLRFREWFDLLACVLGVGFAAWLYKALLDRTDSGWSATWLLRLLVTVVACWLAVVSADRGGGGGLRLWMDRFFSAVGLSLVILYGLAYFFTLGPTPWPIVVAGSAFSIGLTALLRKLMATLAKDTGILLVGFDSIAAALAPPLRDRIVGVLDDDPARVSPGLPFLGDLSHLSEAVAASRPSRIIVNDRKWRSRISARQLLDLRYSGIAIESGPDLYESMLCRVSWDHLDPLDLLFSSSSGGSRAAAAFQAVYTNLIGLGLLLLLSPVLIVTTVLVGLFSGSVPVETFQCPGLQGTPFQLVRFRTRRTDGQFSRIGRIVSRLHLVNLPQLINVVRGEMALFGPPPVRRSFAERLRQILPIYAQRFAVKPGILGWSQVNLRYCEPAPDETLRLEYDLYYVKQESPSLDLDIFVRTLAGVPASSPQVPPARP